MKIEACCIVVVLLCVCALFVCLFLCANPTNGCF